jgi:hypothetical protein
LRVFVLDKRVEIPAERVMKIAAMSEGDALAAAVGGKLLS